jgi:hypothetical protein
VFADSILVGGKTKDDAYMIRNLYKRLISESCWEDLLEEPRVKIAFLETVHHHHHHQHIACRVLDLMTCFSPLNGQEVL